MVKGAAKSAASSSSTGGSGAPSAQPLPTMQTGQNVNDPLTALNGHQGFGLMAGFNPFADMGVNPTDPNMVSYSRCSISLCIHADTTSMLPAPRNDVLARIPPTNVLTHVQPRHHGPNHRFQPSITSRRTSGQTDVPERTV